MAATITPISEKQGQRLGKLQEAERLHAELALLLADIRARLEANPFAHDRIGNPAHEAEKRAYALANAAGRIFSLSDEMDCDAYEARERLRAMGGRR